MCNVPISSQLATRVCMKKVLLSSKLCPVSDQCDCPFRLQDFFNAAIHTFVCTVEISLATNTVSISIHFPLISAYLHHSGSAYQFACEKKVWEPCENQSGFVLTGDYQG